MIVVRVRARFVLVTCVAIFLAFLAVGAMANQSGKRSVSVHPVTATATVTKSVPGPTKTQTKTVTSMPSDCAKALDIGDRIVTAFTTFEGSYGPVPDIINDAFNAIARGDSDGVNSARLSLQAAEQGMSDSEIQLVQLVQEYATARSACTTALGD